MPLIIELEAALMNRNKRNIDIVKATGHTSANVSKFKKGHIRSIRLSTLHDICVELNCQPGDLIKYVTEEELACLREKRAQIAAERLRAGLDQPIAPEQVYVVDIDE